MLWTPLGSLSRKAARYLCSKPLHMRNRRPLVSFTFDDVPDSAYLNGARILDEHDVSGTFYIAAGTCGAQDTLWRVIDAGQVHALHEGGHEIGCHTFSHVPVETLDERTMTDECERNAARLHELCPGLKLSNFCYPFGRVSLARKLQLRDRFDTCRGIHEGINARKLDLSMLRVIELYDRTLSADKLDRVLSETQKRNGWLIFYTHDVADPPSWIGCSPGKLEATVRAVQARGLACLSVRDALREVTGERAAQAFAGLSAGAAGVRPDIG